MASFSSIFLRVMSNAPLMLRKGSDLVAYVQLVRVKACYGGRRGRVSDYASIGHLLLLLTIRAS